MNKDYKALAIGRKIVEQLMSPKGNIECYMAHSEQGRHYQTWVDTQGNYLHVTITDDMIEATPDANVKV